MTPFLSASATGARDVCRLWGYTVAPRASGRRRYATYYYPFARPRLFRRRPAVTTTTCSSRLSSESPLLSSYRRRSLVAATDGLRVDYVANGRQQASAGCAFLSLLVLYRSSRRRKIREIRGRKSEFSLMLPNYERLRIFEGNIVDPDRILFPALYMTRVPGIIRDSRASCAIEDRRAVFVSLSLDKVHRVSCPGTAH